MKLNKKQKRTATIASMAALLAVVLGMGGQTFAKYITTTKTESNKATVAQWGFVITNTVDNADATTPTLFAKEYGDDDVKALGKTTSDLVAPGTNGSVEIEVNGVAEVKAQMKFEFSTTNVSVNVKSITKTYYPIRWTLSKVDTNGTSYLAGFDSTKTADETSCFVDYVSEISSYITTFNAGADSYIAATTEFDEVKYVLSWDWKLSYTEECDDYDTALGLASAGATYDTTEYTNVNLGLDVTFGLSLTQVQ